MNTKNVYDVAVVGAGISALLFAHKLPDQKVILLEKSKGVGGRLATRRLQNVAFNHGARNIMPEHFLLKEVVKIGLEHHFLEMQGEIAYPTQGINQWTKLLAQDKEILKESLVHKIVKNPEGFLEVRDSSDLLLARSRKVVLSTPAPQAYEILKNSGLDASFLAGVKYSSSIQFLAILEHAIPNQSALWKQWEVKQNMALTEGIFYHLECRVPFIKEHFELDKTVIQNQVLGICQAEGLGVKESHLHKWRFSEVTQAVSPSFQMFALVDNIYLMGDYFYGHDINSAAKSVDNLLNQVTF